MLKVTEDNNDVGGFPIGHPPVPNTPERGWAGLVELFNNNYPHYDQKTQYVIESLRHTLINAERLYGPCEHEWEPTWIEYEAASCIKCHARGAASLVKP